MPVRLGPRPGQFGFEIPFPRVPFSFCLNFGIGVDSNERIDNVMSDEVYKNCQSCGMPLKRDELGGGTEANGTKSTMYCSHCYQNGRFVFPDITLEQMQARVREKIVEFGMPGFMAGLFTRKIPSLARWRK